MVPVILRSAGEEMPPPRFGLLRFQDSETGAMRLLWMRPALQRAWMEAKRGARGGAGKAVSASWPPCFSGSRDARSAAPGRASGGVVKGTHVALAAAALLVAAPAFAQVRDVRLHPPDRLFAYFIGDLLQSRFEIVTDPGWTIEPASLPAPHALDYWLDLRDVRSTVGSTADGATLNTVTLTYQTFYDPLEPKRMTIPEIHVALRNGTATKTVAIGPWQFLSSPLREVSPQEGIDFTASQPDEAPQPVDLAPLRRSVLFAAITTVLAAIAIAYRMPWWPLLRRRARPFTQASRRLQRMADGEDAYREGLLLLHGAIDATAGAPGARR